jgi:hypothetical protein
MDLLLAALRVGSTGTAIGVDMTDAMIERSRRAARDFSGSACGAGMSGKPSTTVAFEKRFNPMLALDRDAFVEALIDVPPKPAEMATMIEFNKGS